MRLVNSEVITVAAGETKTCTRSEIDNGSGPKATLAIVSNHDLGDSDVGFRIGDEPPVEGDYTYHPILAGGSVEIDGYDNLIGAQFILVGSVTAKLFVEYYA